MINNPGIRLFYGPRPGSCDYVPPIEQIQQILDFIEISVSEGTLEGIGPGKSAENRLNALINMLESAKDFIIAEDFVNAFDQLVDVLGKCDGDISPPDFVTGEAREELANLVGEE